MDRRLNVAAVALLVGLFALIAKPSSAVVNLEFDAAYTVAAPFSTDPVNVFDIEGPPPWLYLDLPDAATSSFIVAAPSDWFRELAETKQFSLSNTEFARQDQYWFSPTDDVWNATKATGNWRVDASHSLVNLIIIYGGGVGQVWATGSGTIHFTVSSGIPGDFNNNGCVDALDYTVWRNTSGATGAGLAADGDGNQIVNNGDYEVWRTNYGRSSLSAAAAVASSQSAVPEPSSLLSICLVMMGKCMALVRTRR